MVSTGSATGAGAGDADKASIPAASTARAEIVVDLAAFRGNIGRLRRWFAAGGATPPQLMVVVKADGYGHGLLPIARAARAAGADWLGTATLEEAIAVREAGDTGPVLCWLFAPGEDYAAAISRDIDLTAYSIAELAEMETAAADLGRTARVQLKVDTGLSRGGAAPRDWRALVAAARDAELRGRVVITGIWSHLAASDDPGHPANASQEAVFAEAVAVAEEAGLRPQVRHLANSAAAILRPSSRFDLVRCGIACYGQDPAPGVTPAELGLVPAMTVRGRLAMTKRVARGAGVSYGHTWIAEEETTLGLVPLGYADGVPRQASSVAEVWVAGRRRPVRGRICMDQFVVDLHGEEVPAGAEFLLFGPGDRGEPTAQDWAVAVGTINYEIITRVGGRMLRRYVDEEDPK